MQHPTCATDATWVQVEYAVRAAGFTPRAVHIACTLTQILQASPPSSEPSLTLTRTPKHASVSGHRVQVVSLGGTAVGEVPAPERERDRQKQLTCSPSSLR